MTRDEVSAVLEDALGWAKDRSLRDMGKVFKAASVVNALYTERDSLLTVRETLKRECEATKAENVRLRQALKTLHKNPDDCTDPDDGLCVSHAAYLDLVEQIEAVGWRWDDSLDRWASPLNGEDHE